MLFIVIRTKTAAASQRALEVSLGVTRSVPPSISTQEYGTDEVDSDIEKAWAIYINM
jgi:hypothetical protein